MVSEKKETGKTVIIVVLLLALLGLGGCFVYDKIDADNTKSELEKEVNSLNSEIVKLKNENVGSSSDSSDGSSSENKNYENAVYYGFKDDEASNYHVKEFLTLFNDGTFVDIFVGSEASSGTYEIKGNELILYRGGNVESPGESKCQISPAEVVKDGLTLRRYS